MSIQMHTDGRDSTQANDPDWEAPMTSYPLLTNGKLNISTDGWINTGWRHDNPLRPLKIKTSPRDASDPLKKGTFYIAQGEQRVCPSRKERGGLPDSKGNVPRGLPELTKEEVKEATTERLRIMDIKLTGHLRAIGKKGSAGIFPDSIPKSKEFVKAEELKAKRDSAWTDYLSKRTQEDKDELVKILTEELQISHKKEQPPTPPSRKISRAKPRRKASSYRCISCGGTWMKMLDTPCPQGWMCVICTNDR
jgi:hypothetical protein